VNRFCQMITSSLLSHCRRCATSVGRRLLLCIAFSPSTDQLERLRRIAQNDLAPRFREIQETMLITEIRGFGNTVGELGLEFGVKAFQHWGAALVSTSDRFDVEGMMTAFSEFPELFLKIPGGWSDHDATISH
jgi:hypothetical protein